MIKTQKLRHVTIGTIKRTAAASLVFTGPMNGVSMEIDISGFSGLTTNVDTFTAVMHYNISTNYQPVYSNVFVETSSTSGLFRSVSSFTVSRGDLKVTVTPLDGTLPGSYVPVVERIKGPADLLGTGDYTLKFMGSTFELEEDDGWYYPKGGSPRFWVATDGKVDPKNPYLTYYDPDGNIAVTKESDQHPDMKLMTKDITLFERTVKLLDINLKGYEAWRLAARENEMVPSEEEEQPGFLITAETGAKPLQAKIVVAKLDLPVNGIGGLTRWLRFSDHTKVTLKRGNDTIDPTESELEIAGLATDDAEYQICMRDPEKWAADTSVTVEYFIRDKEGRRLPGADKVRLLRPVIIAIGDSLTFGYMADANRKALTANWKKPWKNYPTQDDWNKLKGGPLETAVTNQGWRGDLRNKLPGGSYWAGEAANNRPDGFGGHGPRHCGYSGAETAHINGMLTLENGQSRSMLATTLQTTQCYAIIIYFIGVNDCNRRKSNSGEDIYRDWLYGLEIIRTVRRRKGKSLFVVATTPLQAPRYFDPKTPDPDHPAIIRLKALNASIRRSRAYESTMKEQIVDLADEKMNKIAHSSDDDGLHFLNGTYELIAKEISNAIREGVGK